MNKLIAGSILLLLAMTTEAFATSKICFGSKKNEATSGVIMLATITPLEITMKTLKRTGDFSEGYDGKFPALQQFIKGRDGKTYVTYKGQVTDYQDIVMVDQSLLQDGTTGLLQIRARGEGFFNSVFLCKDAR
jgi:hypothetical protein